MPMDHLLITANPPRIGIADREGQPAESRRRLSKKARFRVRHLVLLALMAPQARPPFREKRGDSPALLIPDRASKMVRNTSDFSRDFPDELRTGRMVAVFSACRKD